MSAEPAVIGLIPDQASAQPIQAAKAAVLRVVGAQRYLDDPPHLTVFLACFADLEAVSRAVAAVAAAPAPLQVKAEGWHVFRNDPLTGGHTPVAAISAVGKSILRQLQARVLSAVAPLRDPAASTARYAGAWGRLTPERRVSTERWGFPFTGEDWHPHVSVCSIALPDWDGAWAELAPMAPQGAIAFEALELYRLVEDRPRLIRRFALEGA